MVMRSVTNEQASAEGTTVRADYNTEDADAGYAECDAQKRRRYGPRGLSSELQVFLRHPSLPAVFREHCVDPV